MSPELVTWSREVERFVTPIPDAIEEVRRRQADGDLRDRIEEYLGGDIPLHFQRGPVLYLSRHVATPNFETLRFIELAQNYHLPIIIGQDPEDIFVSNNALKRALGKMPIVKCLTCDEQEVVENFTIVHFDSAQGKPFKDIRTIFGQDITSFHNDLFKAIYPEGIKLVNEAPWIDRNHRGDLVEHYKRFLALFILHGVMFENYELEEQTFVTNVLLPAYEFVEQQFGIRPLICNLVAAELIPKRNWNAYPSVLYKIVKNALELKKVLS